MKRSEAKNEGKSYAVAQAAGRIRAKQHCSLISVAFELTERTVSFPSAVQKFSWANVLIAIHELTLQQ